VTKPIPEKTLRAGDRFVLVASGSVPGKKGEDDRREALANEASASSLPTSPIDVIGSERLTSWCNQHPAIAAQWAGRPPGLLRFDEWARIDVHQVAWQATPEVEKAIADRRRDLDFGDDDVLHIHVQGPSGVGKTRLALEICRGASWNSSVIYVQQADDVPLLQLINGAIREPDVRMVVVADEVSPQKLLPLRDSLSLGQGRVRLITIGLSPTPDDARIPAMQVRPLAREPMARLVSGWYPEMPRVHVDFIVRFADGYVRLARLAADAVKRNPAADVRNLLDQQGIRVLLDRMLGDDERESLYVVAALRSVGWTDERQCEGESIARHFGLDWAKVQTQVHSFDRRLQIAQPKGLDGCCFRGHS
jgi:hypothetical protein